MPHWGTSSVTALTQYLSKTVWTFLGDVICDVICDFIVFWVLFRFKLVYFLIVRSNYIAKTLFFHCCIYISYGYVAYLDHCMFVKEVWSPGSSKSDGKWYSPVRNSPAMIDGAGVSPREIQFVSDGWLKCSWFSWQGSNLGVRMHTLWINK